MGKYIIFTYDYPTNNGGISRLCGEIRNKLLARGLDVLVITCTSGPEENGVVRIKGKRGILELKMRKALKYAFRPGDIVLTDTWHPAGTLALTVTKDVFILAHGAELLPGFGFAKTSIWHSYRRRILKKAKGIIANSNYTSGLVSGCSPDANVIGLPLPIDGNYFHPTKEKITNDDILRICTLSRLEKFKGHDFVIRTIASLPLEKRKKLRFEIGGKGDYKETLEDLVSSYGLEDIITFKGFMSDEEVLDFYSRNDLFILCTREEPIQMNVEGFGLVFTEAQACGTAVIGTRTGGIPSAVTDGVGGWLIEQDNTKELQDILINLIDNKKKAQAEGIVARNRVLLELNWDKYCNELLNFIDQ